MKPTAMQLIWEVFRKEVMDNWRDQRSLISSLLSALLTPAMLLALIMIIGRTVFKDATEGKLQLPTIGAENAPSLIQYLKQHNTEILPGPADPQAAIVNGDAEVVLIIPPNYGEEFSAGRTATVQLVMDSSRTSSAADIQRARGLLNGYGEIMASMRLMARGINPEIITPIAIERVDTATPQSQVLIFLNMMPYFVIMIIFIGGLHVIIDATAGEKERGSLEPLLINPVPRWIFVLGKLGASLPYAILLIVSNLVAFAVAFNVVPLEDFVGFPMTIDLTALVWIFIISLPITVLAAALQMIIATFTRSFKEAQTYTGFLPLIPALPGLGLAFIPVKPALWTMLIPTFGQQILINQFMRGEPVDPANIIISAVVTIILGIVLILVAIRLFQQERVIFGAR